MRARAAARALSAATLAALPFLAVPPAGAWATSSVYVAHSGGSFVLQFDVLPGGALASKTPSTVDTQGPGGAQWVAVSPDGRSAYVTNIGGTIAQFDVGPGGGLSPKSPATLPTGGTNSHDVAVAPDGTSAYVANGSSGDVSQYDIGPDGKLAPKAPARVAAGSNPWGLVLSPNGRSAYVTNAGSNNVSQYDIGAGGKLTPKTPPTVATGLVPLGVAVSPDGRNVYVASRDTAQVFQYGVGADGTLTPKEPAAVSSRIGPRGVAVSPDGKSAYVTNDQTGDSHVSQYDVGSDGGLHPKTPASVGAPERPQHLVVSPDGRSVYVTRVSASDPILHYNVGLGGVLTPKSPPAVAQSGFLGGVAFLPNQGPVASFAAVPGPAGADTGFDASSSSDVDGRVVRYDWSFGDMTVAFDAGPRPSHTYAAPGTYVAALRVTDDAGCSSFLVFTGQTAHCNGGSAAIATRQIVVPAGESRAPARQTRVALTALRIRPRSFRPARRGGPIHGGRPRRGIGARVSYRLDRPAQVRFAIERARVDRRAGRRCRRPSRPARLRRCVRFAPLSGSFIHRGRAGVNQFRFTGRLRRTLRAGGYRLAATPSADGLRGKARRVRFRILRR